MVGFYAAGIVMLTYYFMSKPLKYLDDIIDATGQMLENKDEVIVLPKAMRNVEDELNMLRKQSIKNELISRAAEQRKNDLIVYLAHDLKTPLTSVIGYLNLLVDEPDISAATRARYTGIALEKAERLEELINDFFDITRFNLTTLTLDMENTNLSMMLEQIAFEFRPLLADKELEIVTELESNVNIMCDRDKLERVFDNLLRNAINYSYNGTKIILSMKRDNDNVRIVVSNVGKTILPEKLARIFEQFYRVDSSRSTSTGGSGLGLAIAKEIVELHGGTIEVASADEKIVFTLTLPS
ncbi:MAG TPA: vancomycin resistance histidine kinase VanS [Eubacterium sp.]|nr:vancomycin resistance histidine kinase VanS [Eubacterium sp.]HAZ85063.1 vancomycin resistance histidine kinase VanS [Eubacterium sp.]